MSAIVEGQRPVSNKVRVQQLETELARTRNALVTTENRLAYATSRVEGLTATLESVRTARKEDEQYFREQHQADAQTIRELKGKVDNLNTQLVGISSILNAAKTLVVGALPQSQAPSQSGLGDILASVLGGRR